MGKADFEEAVRRWRLRGDGLEGHRKPGRRPDTDEWTVAEIRSALAKANGEPAAASRNGGNGPSSGGRHSGHRIPGSPPARTSKEPQIRVPRPAEPAVAPAVMGPSAELSRRAALVEGRVRLAQQRVARSAERIADLAGS